MFNQLYLRIDYILLFQFVPALSEKQLDAEEISQNTDYRLIRVQDRVPRQLIKSWLDDASNLWTPIASVITCYIFVIDLENIGHLSNFSLCVYQPTICLFWNEHGIHLTDHCSFKLAWWQPKLTDISWIYEELNRSEGISMWIHSTRVMWFRQARTNELSG